jgi:hypothetical protein
MTADSPFFENDQETLQKEANRVDTTGTAATLYLNPGATTVRVLPTWKQGGVYFKEFHEHYLRVDGRSHYLTCPLDDSCAVCEEYERLCDLGDERSMELADEILPRPKFLFNVVLLGAPPSETPLKLGDIYVMKAPVTVKASIVKMDRDEAGSWYDVTSPIHGVNLRITKEGRGLSTKYQVMPDGARTNLVDYLASIGLNKTLEQIQQEMHNLDDVFPPRSPEDAKRLVGRASRKLQRITRPAQEVPVSAPTPTVSAPAPSVPSSAPVPSTATPTSPAPIAQVPPPRPPTTEE